VALSMLHLCDCRKHGRLNMGRLWLRNADRQYAQKYIRNVITKPEFKLPEKYKGTFIEKWGRYKQFDDKIPCTM
jgi:hypothetical protein